MKLWLFLDDTEARHNYIDGLVYTMKVEIHHVRTAAEACQKLAETRYDTVWLDHDLDSTDPDETGMTVARFIADHQAPSKKPGAAVVHSWNTERALHMVDVLEGAGIDTIYKPFAV